MKRTLIFLIGFVLLTGCTPKAKPSFPTEKSDFSAGVWVSLYEMKSVGLNAKQFQEKFDKMFYNIRSLGCDAVFCHVKPDGSVYYKSEILPFSDGLTGTEGLSPDFDPLDILTKTAKKHNLKFHAWLNPYRIKSGISDITELSKSNPARIWLEDKEKQNDKNVLYLETENKKTYYYNPASEQVKKLVLEVCREILENYEVDGIHIDDYFYPTTDENFDKESYLDYCKTASYPLSLGDFRRTNVDTLVSALYSLCKTYGTTFGVSPSAHISTDKTDENYLKQYADIAKWMQSDGYIDYIAPQLYFGYEYPDKEFRFDNLLKKWQAIPRNENIKLYIGLANYKIGTLDADSDEWKTKQNIIAKQTKLCYSEKTDGVIYFSYSSVFENDELNRIQRKKIKKVLKNIKKI